jgi:hypothetical protein
MFQKLKDAFMRKVKKLSDVEMKYIDLNWESMSYEQIAVKLSITVTLVQYYCGQNGYKKVKPKRGERPPKQKIYRNKGPERTPIQRPPAVYSNVSRDQHIDRLLNISI